MAARFDCSLKVLLVDGQNNHAWKETSPVLVSILEGTGRFDVDVATSPAGPPKAPRKPKNASPEKMEAFNAALKSFETRLLPASRRIREMGASGSKRLPEIEALDTPPREPSLPAN